MLSASKRKAEDTFYCFISLRRRCGRTYLGNGSIIFAYVVRKRIWTFEAPGAVSQMSRVGRWSENGCEK